MLANNTDYDIVTRFCYLKDTLLIYRPYEKRLSVERKARFNSHSPCKQTFLSCMALSALRSRSHRMSVK